MTIFRRIFKSEFSKYVAVSIVGYPLIFIALYFMVDIAKINESIAFFATYCLSYIAIYFTQLKIIFRKSHTTKKSLKFLLNIGIFFILANFIFNILLVLKIHYQIATIATIAILFPFRFLSYKFFVYK